MNKKEILNELEKYNLDKENCIILSGASLAVQEIIEETSDIDIATTTDFYNSLNWETKIGALGKEIKFKDNVEISNNLYNDNKVVVVDGYKFSNLDFVLEVKEMLYRLKDKTIIKKLRKQLHNKSLLKFLGTGSMQNHSLKNTSAYIKFDKTMLLIDCGMSTFFELLKQNLLSNLDEIYIAITHSHPDHIGSLATLILYLKMGSNTKINIIVNEKFKEQKPHIELYLKLNGAIPEFYNFIDVSNVDSFFKIDSEKIFHCPELDSYAYNITIDNETTYYYLGDNNDPEFLSKKCEVLRKSDYLFTDVSIKPHNVHLCLDNLLKVVPKEKLNQIICMHFQDEESAKKLKELGFNIAEAE